MTIESLYWKEELARIAKTIRPVLKPKRWSERAVCTVERDVMIGFFIVRRLIELHKVSSRIADKKLNVFCAPVTQSITKGNWHRLEENYDWNAEKAEKKSVSYLSNQCIHAYLSFVFRGKDRNWSDLVVVSDFDRNKTVWRIPFPEIIELFQEASKDWPHTVRMTFNPKTGDYDVVTN
ncbi:hypothetical protein [Tabrizicola sp.]|uniref:hypothetical protein n=1 Tax=Tabrizicola sp. TaxID=2005166 RepID=UPI0035AF3339